MTQHSSTATAELIAAYDEYIKLLASSESSLLGLAHAHGYRCPDELVQRGKELRGRIAELKISAPAQGSRDAEEADRYFNMAGEFGHHLQKLAAAVQDAIDILTERKRGSDARSPGHNARVILETALKSVPASALPSSTQGVATERPSVIVISDWLANCRAGQWTPFEAATALKAALAKEGYTIVPSPDSKLEAYRTALEDAQERLANISSGRCPNAPPGTGGPVAFHEWASGYADIGYSVVRKALAAGG